MDNMKMNVGKNFARIFQIPTSEEFHLNMVNSLPCNLTVQACAVEAIYWINLFEN
jgi:hypothetical protein